MLDQVAEILAEYKDHLPLTVRQVFYRLVGNYGYQKTERAYANLADKLLLARRAGLIDFADLRDDGVSVVEDPWYASPEDFWDNTGRRLKDYRRDRQQGQNHRLELWCEAAGVMPQLARIANEYSMPVYSSGGFMSLSVIRQIVDRVIRRAQPTVILHVGDLDPSGVAVFEHIQEDLTTFIEADRVIGTQSVTCVRVALLDWQVNDYHLDTAPPKKTGRAGRWRSETCQLEALPPDLLATLVDAGINEWFDPAKLLGQTAAERLDQQSIRALLPGGG